VAQSHTQTSRYEWDQIKEKQKERKKDVKVKKEIIFEN